MFDEPALRRWMSLEMGKVNEGVVAERKRLSDLIPDENPVTRTRAGKEYRFNRKVLRTLQEKLPARMHHRLRLPIIFYFDMEVGDSCFLADDAALAALQHLGELSHMRGMEGGRAWVGKAIVFAILQRYPSAVQIMMR